MDGSEHPAAKWPQYVVNTGPIFAEYMTDAFEGSEGLMRLENFLPRIDRSITTELQRIRSEHANDERSIDALDVWAGIFAAKLVRLNELVTHIKSRPTDAHMRKLAVLEVGYLWAFEQMLRIGVIEP